MDKEPNSFWWRCSEEDGYTGVIVVIQKFHVDGIECIPPNNRNLQVLRCDDTDEESPEWSNFPQHVSSMFSFKEDIDISGADQFHVCF